MLEAKLCAALNCYSIGNHLICFGPFRFKSAAIGAVSVDSKSVLDREGTCFHRVLTRCEECACAAASSNRQWTGNGAAATEGAAVYAHWSSARGRAGPVIDDQAAFLYKGASNVPISAGQFQRASAELSQRATIARAILDRSQECGAEGIAADRQVPCPEKNNPVSFE